jgi:hypothetical protein
MAMVQLWDCHGIEIYLISRLQDGQAAKTHINNDPGDKTDASALLESRE